MLERQKEGIQIAKAAGKYKGRKSILLPDNFHSCYQTYKNRENNYTYKHFMRDTGLKKSKLFHFINQLKQQPQEQEQVQIQHTQTE